MLSATKAAITRGSHRRVRLSMLFFSLTVLSLYVHGAGLYILHESRDAVNEIRRVDRSWVAIRDEMSGVFDQGVLLTRAGNDVFLTANPDGERVKQVVAEKTFRSKLANLRSVIRSNGAPAHVTPVLAMIDRIESYGRTLDIRADVVIDRYAAGRLELAVPAMTTMNASLSGYNYLLKQLTASVSGAQQEVLGQRAQVAGRLSYFGMLIALAALVVAPFSLAFGIGLARRERRDAAHQALILERTSASELRLRGLTKRLEESNRDLQDFAHVASHDLQEPLRKIIAFGDRLKTRFGGDLPADGLDYLSRMQSAAGRMQTLIQDLLTFSRVSSKRDALVDVSLNDVAAGVAADLEVAVERAGGVLMIGDLPGIDADPTQMRQMLQNLIGNALKFRRQGVTPEILVGARILGAGDPELPEALRAAAHTWCQLTVSDNGIGFEEKYLDRIFTVFQRLQGRTEYEGSGVGLSVCRRITERHGGHITARSKPGVGTAFIVTLPVDQEYAAAAGPPPERELVFT